eukprot:1342502-Pyramimonas_sp.AAC.1
MTSSRRDALRTRRTKPRARANIAGHMGTLARNCGGHDARCTGHKGTLDLAGPTYSSRPTVGREIARPANLGKL